MTVCPKCFHVLPPQVLQVRILKTWRRDFESLPRDDSLVCPLRGNHTIKMGVPPFKRLFFLHPEPNMFAIKFWKIQDVNDSAIVCHMSHESQIAAVSFKCCELPCSFGVRVYALKFKMKTWKWQFSLIKFDWNYLYTSMFFVFFCYIGCFQK